MPKLKTLQIIWHGKEPVYSLDFHRDGTLATAGGDKEVKLWKVTQDGEGYPQVEHLASLTGHGKTVNCVRFSPVGDYIVSAGDGGELLLWIPQEKQFEGNLVSEEEANAGWRRGAVLRGHTDDVMDVAWSRDGTALLSGSIDNKSIVWEVTEKRKGVMVNHFSDHKHFVQGVIWDPLQQFMLTQSADRTCRVYALRPPAAKKNRIQKKDRIDACNASKEFYCLHTMSKRIVVDTGAANEAGPPMRFPMFLDESVPSFFRRPAWSPDGSFVVVPAGTYKRDPNAGELNTVYLYARGKWTAPVAHLPSQPKPVIAAKFCPILFKRDADSTRPKPFEILPYKMVYAIATLDSVVLYDTSSTLPLAAFCQIHFDSITDLSWSSDGNLLAVSSRDCFCTLVSFQQGELGEPIDLSELPEHIRNIMAKDSFTRAPQNGTIQENIDNQEALEQHATLSALDRQRESPSQPQQNSAKKMKRITPVPVSKDSEAPTSSQMAAAQDAPKQPTIQSNEEGSQQKKKERRRITPIAIAQQGNNIGTADPAKPRGTPTEDASNPIPKTSVASLAAAAGQKAAERM